MIIDLHAHYWDRGFIPEAFHRATAEVWAKQEPGRKPEMILPKIEEGLVDPDGRLYIENMDLAGVDCAFIMACDFGIYYTGEEPPVPMEEQLRRYADLQEKYRGRLYAFAFVDARRKNALDVFERAIKEWGMRGYGEFNCQGLSIDYDVVQPILRKCTEFGVPVLVHTRANLAFETVTDYSVSNVSHPVHVARTCERYPDLTVILAHVGYPVWWEEAARLASKYPNCYLEISDWNREIEDPKGLIPKLACMRDWVGADHICFGSDQNSGKRHGGPNSLLARSVDFLQKLPETAHTYGYEFTQKEVDLILGGNAQRIFRL